MAQTLPLNIPIPQSAAIASFNYTDISEGTGIVKYFGAKSVESGTTRYYLTTASPYSNDVITSGSTGTGELFRLSPGKFDFDVKFNRPQNLKGTAYFNISCGATVGTARDGDTKLWVSGAVLQISGATAITDITSIVSGGVLTFPTVNQYNKTFLIPLIIDTTKHIKATETLRMEFEVWAQAGAAGILSYVGFGHDPQARDDPAAGVNPSATLSGANVTTKLELYVPFLLNTT